METENQTQKAEQPAPATTILTGIIPPEENDPEVEPEVTDDGPAMNPGPIPLPQPGVTNSVRST